GGMLIAFTNLYSVDATGNDPAIDGSAITVGRVSQTALAGGWPACTVWCARPPHSRAAAITRSVDRRRIDGSMKNLSPLRPTGENAPALFTTSPEDGSN